MNSHLGGPKQRRLTPFKVLVFILYGRFDCLEWISPTVVKISLGPFSRLLGLKNYRTRDYLVYLAESGYIENLELSYGKAVCRVALPTPLRNQELR